ncbi:MAG: hypothetical protein ABL891_07015 [Burkholderiales bacterium]
MSTKMEIGPAMPPVEIGLDEREKMAQALAYFCVACGREHASGEMRHDDIVCAEAEITTLVRRAQ